MDRPVFLDLTKIKFPVTAIVSILHRISGIALFISLPFMFAWMFMVTFSDASFALYQYYSSFFWIKTIYVLVLLATTYHTLAGLRHIFHDVSHMHSLKSARITAWIVFALFILLSIGILDRMYYVV
jgi:succinate dehydrogenase / fumarate reductase cytochrome b subunit